MKCPECQQAGETSYVYPGHTTETLALFQSFYDEEGRYHHHNGNRCWTTYRCSRGHTWRILEVPVPCWCGWVGVTVSVAQPIFPGPVPEKDAPRLSDLLTLVAGTVTVVKPSCP
jgi:hypothetical protein